MTTRYTNAEWTSIIAETEQKVLSSVSEEPRPCPPIDSRDFARTIDHTLLKIETTRIQIDALCAEARVAGFAVGTNFLRLPFRHQVQELGSNWKAIVDPS